MNKTTKGKAQSDVCATDWLGFYRVAVENGDGFVPGFLELLMKAEQSEAPPRLVVSNDKPADPDRVSAERHRARASLTVVQQDLKRVGSGEAG